MEIDFWQPLAGLGLFLFAMRLIEAGLEAVSGHQFRAFLRSNTDRPLKGIATGTVATAILQSSSLVGLMTLALVGAGVIRMRNALGVIFGANLGTTATGWIVATIGFQLDLDAAALPLIGVGGILAIALTGDKKQAWARIVFGIGLLLMGLEFMKSAVGNVDGLIDPATLAGFSALEFLLFGVIFSAVVQSSSATMMVTLSALHGGVIDLPSAAAVAIGADLGTTVTLLIGAVKGNPAKKRVAAGHFIFNLVTDVFAFLMRSPLLLFIGLFGLSDLMSLVAFHTLFNLLGILLFLPFLSRFADLLEQRFSGDVDQMNLHLSPEALAVPETAVEAVQLETGHLVRRVIDQNLRCFDPPLTPAADSATIDRLPTTSVLTSLDQQFLDAYERSKKLEGEILAFTTELQAVALNSDESAAIDQYQRVVREAIHSSKCLKDIQHDLRTFHQDPSGKLSRHTRQFRTAASAFYDALLSIKRSARHEISAEDFAALITTNGVLHEDLHRSLYADIRADRIDEEDISMLLNVNRELFISNQSIIRALSVFLLSSPEQDSLELIADRVTGR